MAAMEEERMARLLLSIETVFRYIVGAVLMTIMFIVVADVVLRYVFHAPLVWVHDVIQLYLMSALFFFALSWSYAGRHHINVDLLYRRAPARLRNLSRGLFSLASALVMALIAWKAAQLGWAGYLRGDALSGGIPWPTWISAVIAAIGCAVFVLRLLLEAFLMLTGLGRYESDDDPLVRKEVTI